MRARAALAITAVVMATARLHADLAVGAAAAILDTSVALGLAPAVILIEAIIAARVFRGPGVGTPLVAVVVANLASSILGLVLASFTPFAFRPRGPMREQLVVLMVLCFPFFLISLLVESAVVKRMIPATYHSRVWRWAIEANVVSYVMIEATLLVTLLMGRRYGL
jgi:hypothetical protein